MELHNLKPTEGSRHKKRRVGRGDGSGLGHTAGRGEKGQKSRSGVSSRPHFEGGQIPLFRRLPKRGFKSLSKEIYNVVNLSVLDKHFADGDVVDEIALRDKGVIKKADRKLKILANGEISKKLTVKAVKFSEAAKAKIEAAGGTCEITG